ncbi:GNAT family N-acetyltransferase [Streptomyces acidiscabies]|uniref:GNAT family N-acetyltransferase n=2 Tax=Streptomyces acidiscabies TaxID=42234 RepID=A0AAP6B9Z0_9ACTN|nr:GNAT family N-acetyltransferase [Streptomyces acidiscabies]MDX2960882.1 GNAT family N-acetyltransferase [Streptomyces acidiscabies]MDX3016939.1 GNAT family N-acetyltransferase [Streptomyces acidiscabies]MDX3788891.1 GNAT family N-acetyltransferase [Streptomyces acidiscabies]
MNSGRIRVLRAQELGEGERERWRALRAASPAPRNPFMEPEFAEAVGRVRARTRVAVVYEGREPVGFLPHERGALGMGQALAHGVSDAQGAILAPGLGLDAAELMRACALSSFAFDNLEAEQGLFVPHAAAEYAAYVIDVEKGYDAYASVLRGQSPKFLRTTLAKERRLGRQAGELRFVFDERDPAALRTLMAWKSAQYRRTGRRDRFAQEWITRLVARLADTRAPECAGTLSVLYAGERPVAAHFGLRSSTVLACWFPSYDTEFAKFSPGLVLHLRMAEAAAAEGIGTLDLGRGAAEYKDALKTGEIPVYEGAWTRPGVGAALYWLSREPSRRAHHFVRGRPRLASAAARALKSAGRLRGAGRQREGSGQRGD